MHSKNGKSSCTPKSNQKVAKEAICGNSMLFYVGASRARLELSIIADLTETDCEEIINQLGGSVKRNDARTSLARQLGCKIIV